MKKTAHNSVIVHKIRLSNQNHHEKGNKVGKTLQMDEIRRINIQKP
jgi:hypothetical protein